MITTITNSVPSSLTTADRLTRLMHLEQTGQASLLVERTINKLFAQEIAESRTQLAELQADMAELEIQYAMKSADFYQRYQDGQTDDRIDFVEWASLLQMANNLQKRLEVLTGEKAL